MTLTLDIPRDWPQSIPGMAISPSGRRVAIYFVPRYHTPKGQVVAGDSRWSVYTKAPPHNWHMSVGRWWVSPEAAIEDFFHRGWSLSRNDE